MSRQGLERLRSRLVDCLEPPREGGHAPRTRAEPLCRQVRHAVTGVDAYLTALEEGSRTAAGLRERALDLWQDLEHIASVHPERATVDGGDGGDGGAGVPVRRGPRPEEWAVPPCLKAETVRAGDALVCSFTGDMTLDSEPVAARALDATLVRRPALLAVDLAGVELFTCTGLNLLLVARRRALDIGIPLVLVAPSERTLRVLELTGTAALFPVHPTVEDALRHRPLPSPRPDGG
ncbi:STAS domain-containing protein [Kitasatospora sp. NPDC057512]|uniref:STAS domain-containing protein n=1 Tax=Kitasatospora sp. NPDC057512 TaxID=3346154 RepID=UPI0036B76A20